MVKIVNLSNFILKLPIILNGLSGDYFKKINFKDEYRPYFVDDLGVKKNSNKYILFFIIRSKIMLYFVIITSIPTLLGNKGLMSLSGF